MKVVQESSMISAIEKFDGMDTKQIQKVMEDLAAKQPSLLAFALSSQDHFEEEESIGILLEYLTITWFAFVNEFKTIPQISDDEIMANYEKYEEKMTAMAELTEEEMLEAAVEKFGNPIEPELMGFLIQELMDVQDEYELDDTTASVLLHFLQFIVEILHETVNKPSLRIV